MQAARGLIIAYTDSDCMADKDWLYYLVGTMLEAEYVAVGGPNISPPAQSWAQACVAASPGQPSHVLITDSEAEHIPGCNMAFYKWALESVGGFDPEYRKAGDDVDMCWRLMEHGYRIGFSPAAIVWHHRRFNIRAYFKQQRGYGEAEALLRFKHFVYFSSSGATRWRGQVYTSAHFSTLIQRPVVYHGIFGMGLFQCIYPQRTSDFVYFMGSIEWLATTLGVLLIGLQMKEALFLGGAMATCSASVGFYYGLRARVEAPYHGIWSRILVSLLAIWQPITRGWARYYTWMQKKRTPDKVIGGTPESKAIKIVWDRPSLLSFWSERGTGREHFLKSFESRLDQEGWAYSADTGWTNWDFQIYGNRWWQLHLLTVTEEHGQGKRLTRTRLRTGLTTFSRAVSVIFGIISFVAYLQFAATTEPEAYQWIGAWFCFMSLWLASMFWMSARLRRRLAEVVELAARDCGLTPTHTIK
jgi:hypothetical protein